MLMGILWALALARVEEDGISEATAFNLDIAFGVLCFVFVSKFAVVFHSALSN